MNSEQGKWVSSRMTVFYFCLFQKQIEHHKCWVSTLALWLVCLLSLLLKKKKIVRPGWVMAHPVKRILLCERNQVQAPVPTCRGKALQVFLPISLLPSQFLSALTNNNNSKEEIQHNRRCGRRKMRHNHNSDVAMKQESVAEAMPSPQALFHHPAAVDEWGHSRPGMANLRNTFVATPYSELSSLAWITAKTSDWFFCLPVPLPW